jgi:hypothetical protein
MVRRFEAATESRPTVIQNTTIINNPAPEKKVSDAWPFVAGVAVGALATATLSEPEPEIVLVQESYDRIRRERAEKLERQERIDRATREFEAKGEPSLFSCYSAAVARKREKLSAHCHNTWLKDIDAAIDVTPFIVLGPDNKSFKDHRSELEASVEIHRERMRRHLALKATGASALEIRRVLDLEAAGLIEDPVAAIAQMRREENVSASMPFTINWPKIAGISLVVYAVLLIGLVILLNLR